MMSRLPRLALVATLSAAVLTGGIGNASGGPPPLRVGSELEFPPYAFVDERGRPAGFSVELIKAVADTMGLSVSLSTGTWDNVWEGLTTGRLDVLPIVAKLPGREHLVDFSLPHTETFDAFFVRSGTTPIPDIAAARGKRIVVMRSDAAHHALLERGFPGDLVLVDTIPEGLSLIARGDYDAFLSSKVIGTLGIKSRGLDGLTAGPPIPDYKRIFSFAVRKGNVELLEKLNQGLLIVKTNGEYDRIYERWLAAEDPWRKMEKYLLPGAGIATAAILIAGIWLVTLRRLVRKRTAELAERNELLRLAREGLEARVSQRTAELADANAALQAEMEVRSRGEATIRYRNVVLDGIGRIFRSALTSGTEEELGRAFLAVAGDVTQSRSGFVGIVGKDGRLHALAISGPGRESCTMDGTPGHGETPGNLDFQGLCGRVILEGKGFFKNDPASHPDGIGTPGGEPRVSAFLGAPLIRDGRPIGMVGMANREGGYRAEDLDALTSLADAMVQSLMRKRAEEALQSSVAEKEILLKELAHRTKNNMQVVGSLLSLQAAGSADKELLEALADTQDRISAMALVHENLYRSGNFASLNMRTYLSDLMASLVRTHRGKGGTVRTELDLEDVFASIDTALPCGLIVNELVSNSLKHAIGDRQGGRIYLSLHRTGQGLELRYRDDGPGLPRDLDLSRIESLGLKLVYNLAVRQLRGTMDLRRDPVSEFVITFDALDCAEKA